MRVYVVVVMMMIIISVKAVTFVLSKTCPEHNAPTWNIHKYTWTSPTEKVHNQTDNILTYSRLPSHFMSDLT
jgi:hypothetical protein